MSETIHLPGIGTVDRKYVMIGAVIGAVGLGYMLFRRHENAVAGAAAPAAADDTGDVADDTADDTGYDDSADYGQDLGYDPYASLGDQGPIIGYDSGTGDPIYGTTTTTPAPELTESQWVAQAASDAAANTGADYNTVSAALTSWIAGQTVTAAQEVLIKEAMALDGNPPGGAPPIHVGDAPPTPTAKVPAAPKSLKAAPSTTSVVLTWATVPGATGYHVYQDGHLSESVVYGKSTRSGLKAKTKHTFGVAAFNAAGTSTQATISATTK